MYLCGKKHFCLCVYTYLCDYPTCKAKTTVTFAHKKLITWLSMQLIAGVYLSTTNK